jgi:O-antigen ligase
MTDMSTTAIGRLDAPVARSSAYVMVGQLFVVLYLVFGFGAAPVVSNAIVIAVSALGVISLLIAPVGSVERLMVSASLMLFVGWMLASYAWTNDPSAWGWVVVLQVPPVIAMVCVASVLSAEQIARAVVVTTYIVIAWTIALLILYPESAAQHLPSERNAGILPGWHGNFNHKTVMALFLIFGAITLVLYERASARRTMALVAIPVLVVGSQSVTGLFVLLVVAGLYVWLNGYLTHPPRHSASYLVLSVIAGLFAIAVLWILLPIIVGLQGKDLTFSSRTTIWSASWDALVERPAAGYGMGGLWHDLTLEPTLSISRAVGFPVPHSHNGVLELVLQVGVVGLVLFFVFLGATIAGGARALRRDRRLGTWTILSCALVVLSAFSEPTFTAPWLVALAGFRVLTLRSEREDRTGVAR